MKKVDFIIGGAQKCGTSALARYMAQHPDVHIPAGEIHYFDRRIKKQGIDWYTDHVAAEGCRVVGEKTPSYIRFPRIPPVIKTHFPDVKLIFVLRDPVRRAYSHYWHLRRQSLEFRPFEKAITGPFWFGLVKPPDYIERGMYARQLKPWYATFRKDQILVVKTEDLKAKTREVLNAVFDHLGVRRECSIRTPPVHGAIVPRNLIYCGLMFPVNLLRRVNNSRVECLHVALSRAYQFLLRHGKPGYPEMDQTTRFKLQSFFAPHNRELKDLTGVGWDY